MENTLKMELLKKLCNIHAPSGHETEMHDFVLEYVNQNKLNWKVQPEIFEGDGFQDCIILVFGKPRTAVFTHMDNIGYTVGYHHQLIKIGGPVTENKTWLTGRDSSGDIECMLIHDQENNILFTEFERNIDPGTTLNFKSDFRESENFIQSCYIDNRLGVYVSLKIAETLENGIIVFSCREEHGGGSVPFLLKFIYENYKINQSLICDISWVTKGVHHGKGPVVSLRDSGIPRKKYTDRIRKILTENNVSFQTEIEASGGSDGNEIQRQPYPVDWCFVGAPEDNVHTADEKVHKEDIRLMILAYEVLMKEL